MISAEELARLGLPAGSLKIQHPVTGKQGYRAAVEVFHQLHCLNLIRQAVYKDYYQYHGGDVGDAEGKEDLQGHVGEHGWMASRAILYMTGGKGRWLTATTTQQTTASRL